MPTPESTPETPPPRARTYLGWSLAATVLCFLPLGLVALLFGLQVDRAVVAGDTDRALRKSRVARRWLIATVVAGVLVYATIVIVLAMLGAFSE